MRLLGVAFLLITLTACEKPPAAQEEAAVESKPNRTVTAPTPVPTAAPGDWRLKNYKPALDQRPGDQKKK